MFLEKYYNCHLQGKQMYFAIYIYYSKILNYLPSINSCNFHTKFIYFHDQDAELLQQLEKKYIIFNDIGCIRCNVKNMFIWCTYFMKVITESNGQVKIVLLLQSLCSFI